MIIIKKRKYHFLLLLIAFLISSCRPGQATGPIGNVGTHNAGVNPVENIAPTFTAELGGFHVRLINFDTNGAVSGQFVYLADMLPVQGNLKGAYVPSIDLKTAPRSASTIQGDVVISLVPPGKYALALFSPLGPIVVKEANTENDITFDITADKITDLGDRKIILDKKIFPPSK